LDEAVPWTALAELKKNAEILKKIDEFSALLKTLEGHFGFVALFWRPKHFKPLNRSRKSSILRAQHLS